MVELHLFDLFQHLPGFGVEVDAVGAVDLFGDLLEFLLDGKVELIEAVEIGAVLVELAEHFLGQIDAAFAALGEDLRKGDRDLESLAAGFQSFDLGVRVGFEAVDGGHHGQPEFL